MKIVIDINDIENEFIKKESKKKNLSIENYVKDKVFKDNFFELYYIELISRTDKINNNTKFSIKLLFGTDWLNIPKGIKLALGRKFYKEVSEKIIKNIDYLYKDSSNTAFYIKKDL